MTTPTTIISTSLKRPYRAAGTISSRTLPDGTVIESFEGLPMLCYDLGNFHSSCPTVEVSYPWVYCVGCRVVAHVDLVGVHITVESSKKAAAP